MPKEGKKLSDLLYSEDLRPSAIRFTYAQLEIAAATHGIDLDEVWDRNYGRAHANEEALAIHWHPQIHVEDNSATYYARFIRSGRDWQNANATEAAGQRFARALADTLGGLEPIKKQIPERIVEIPAFEITWQSDKTVVCLASEAQEYIDALNALLASMPKTDSVTTN